MILLYPIIIFLSGEFEAHAVSQGKILSKIFDIVVNSPSSHTCYEAACDAICSATYAMEDLHVNRLIILFSDNFGLIFSFDPLLYSKSEFGF